MATPQHPGPDPMGALLACVARWTSGRRALLTGSAILLVLAVGFFNPIFRANATFSDVAGHQTVIWPWAATPTGFGDTYPQSDQADTTYPWTVFAARAFRSGTVPLWNPDSFAGTPFLTNGLGMTLYPPRVLFQVLVSSSWTHDLIMLLQLFLSGVAMFALLRALETGFLGSLLAAVAWMFASFNSVWIQFELVGVFATFFPFALMCVYLASVRRSWWWAGLGGAGLGLEALGSSLQLAGPSAFVVAIFAVCLAIRELRGPRADRSPLKEILGRPLLVAVVAAGSSAPIALPSFILSRQIGRQSTSLDYLETHAVPWRTLLLKTFVVPPLPPTSALFTNAVFAGSAVAVLALFALVALPLRRPGSSLARLTCIGSALVLAGTPLASVPYHLVPGFSYLTGLGRMTVFWCFAIAFLGGLGLDRALQLTSTFASRRGDASSIRAIGLVSAGVAVCVIAFSGYQTVSFARSANPPFQPRTSADLFPDTPAILALRHDAATRPPTETQRVMPLRISNPPMYASHAMVPGIESAAGYESLAVSRTVDFWRVVEGENAREVLSAQPAKAFIANYFTAKTRYDLLARGGITTIFAPPELDSDPGWIGSHGPSLHLTQIYAGPDGQVLDLQPPVPRAFVVHRADIVDGEGAALLRYTTPSFPFRQRVVLEQSDGDPAATRGSGPSTAAIALHRGLNGSTWRVRSATPGYFVLLDSWAPGWHATVNGRNAHVLHANGAFRAVEVPAGSSLVSLVYRPAGFVVGVWAAAATLLGFLIAGAVTLVRRRGSTASR